MIWRFLRQYPQLLVLGSIFGGSTLIFILWWMLIGPSTKRKVRPVEDIRPKLELVKSKPERLLLVDNELYDFDTGNLIFSGYVKGGMPAALFFDAGGEKLIARYEGGYARLNLAGQEEARMAPPHGGLFSDRLDWVLFGRNKEIWQADLDWKEFKLVNERQITDSSLFMDSNFARNVVFGSDAILLVRHLNKVLRVALEGGKIEESKLPMENISKRLAPDFRHVVGFQAGHFYWYDVDTDSTKSIPIAKGAVRDYQWVGPTRCAVLGSSDELAMFDLDKGELEMLLRLPAACSHISGPSPDGRFVFCYSLRQGFLVDLEKKSATELPPGDGFFWVGSEAFLLRREGAESERRGSWLYTIGEGEKRISPLPYTVHKTGPAVLWLEKAGLLVLGMPGGLWSAERNGREAKERIPLQSTPGAVLSIGEWKASP